MEWIDVRYSSPNKSDRPEIDETVWLYNIETGYINLGCLVELENEGYFWAESNGILYTENGRIVAECEIDDIGFTHFCRLPKLPTDGI